MLKNDIERLSAFIDRTIEQVVYSLNPTEESPFFPVHIHIEPTNACNLRCVHCHHHAGSREKGVFNRKLGFMAMDTYKKVIDEIAPLQCAISLNCQGEPLLHKNILDMIKYAKDNNIKVSLLTNGTLLSKDISRELINLNLDRIVFSFDAVNEELYESLRIGAYFKDTLNNILFFISHNEQKGHPTFVCMSIIVHNKTKEHIQAYKHFWQNYPIDTIFESSLLNLSGGSGLAGECIIPKIDKQKTPICRVPWENIVVNWDGLVTVCPLDYDCKFVVGDVKNNFLKDLWNNTRYRTFRQAHLLHSFDNIEIDGILCSKCNCLYDMEYDLKSYKLFAKRHLLREIHQHIF